MANRIVSDSFETLGGVVKSTAGQIKQAVKKMGDDVAESVGIKPQQAGTNEQGRQQQQTKSDDQIKKMASQSNAISTRKYREIQKDIHELQLKRKQETDDYHKPGFTEEEKQKNQIKQLEEKKEDKLPPIPVQQASKKTEAFRGVSG